jgi:hypothetical protein
MFFSRFSEKTRFFDEKRRFAPLTATFFKRVRKSTNFRPILRPPNLTHSLDKTSGPLLINVFFGRNFQKITFFAKKHDFYTQRSSKIDDF